MSAKGQSGSAFTRWGTRLVATSLSTTRTTSTCCPDRSGANYCGHPFSVISQHVQCVGVTPGFLG